MAKTKEVLPQYNCKSCTHCIHKYCTVFKRPVDINFNKCWNHGHYQPLATSFKVDNRLEIIMKAEEKAAKEHYKGYLREAEALRQETLKEIEKQKQKRLAS